MANEPDRWVWDAARGRYRNARTGRIVPTKRIQELRDQLITAAGALMSGLAQQLADGKATVGGWEQAMRDAIKALFGAQYVLGRGGLDAMEPADWQRIGDRVQQQYGFLSGFADDIANGTLSQPQIVIRMQLYMGSSVQAHEAGKAAAFEVELPAYPGDGSSECLSNDRCVWHLRRRQDGNVEATWVAEDDPKVCPTCRDRARDWNPLVLIPSQSAPSAGTPRSTKLRTPSRVLMPVNA